MTHGSAGPRSEDLASPSSVEEAEAQPAETYNDKPRQRRGLRNNLS